MKVKFDIMGIVLMGIACWLGTIGGAMLAGMIGLGGGLIGALVVGFIIYAIYTLLTGGKLKIFSGLIFAVLVYIAQIITGVLAGTTGLGGGLIGFFFTAVILSFLWGWFGGRGASPITTGSARTPRHKRRRK